ncbi:hypothetical protein A6U97_27840 [Agrobacterium tumefaciens]|uniref:glycosyltransferase family 2 protein n=1 Tax=Agrobacterium tumefaciens TaxID=358 RepID=UPI00080FCEA6|nr:hypothetical protein A6U97_27840 [Agrobacterium tumefaciens]
MATRFELLLQHSNDYTATMAGRSADRFPPSLLNVVIPYYNSARTIDEVACKALAALEFANSKAPELEAVLSIVDDGSDEPLPLWIRMDPRIRVVQHERNLGRAAARNTGLKSLASTFTMFVDADVLLYPEAVYEHYRVHAQQRLSGHTALTANLFNFVNINHYQPDNSSLFDACNDFRYSCTYLPHWIGCEADSVFIGRQFWTLEETSHWAKWPTEGFFGPWTLPNMVLGGCFTVPTAPSLALQGQDLRFREYGFTETTLVTKLITHARCFIIPISPRFCIHLDLDTEEERNWKNERFRAAHHQFYQSYLLETPPQQEWLGLSAALDSYRDISA